MRFHAVAAEGAVQVFCEHLSEIAFRLHVLRLGGGVFPCLAFHVVAQRGIERVKGNCVLCQCLFHNLYRVGMSVGQLFHQHGSLHGVVGGVSSAVHYMGKRVYATVNLGEVLGLCVAREQVGIHDVEVSVKGDDVHLADERLTHIRHIGAQHVSTLGVHIAETFSLIQGEHEVHLVFGALQTCAVRQYDFGIVISAGVAVNHHTIQHACFRVFLLHKKVVSGNFVVEDSFGDFQFGRFLLHTPYQRGKLFGGFGRHLVLEIETSSAYQNGKKAYGLQNADQGNAGGLHGEQLITLAQVAERYERCQQYCQWQRKRNQR